MSVAYRLVIYFYSVITSNISSSGSVLVKAFGSEVGPARTLHIPFLLQVHDCYAAFLRHFSTFFLGFLTCCKDFSSIQGTITLLSWDNFLALSNKSGHPKHFCSREALSLILIPQFLPPLMRRASISRSNSDVSCIWLPLTSLTLSTLSGFPPCFLCSLSTYSTGVPCNEFKSLTGGCFSLVDFCAKIVRLSIDLVSWRPRVKDYSSEREGWKAEMYMLPLMSVSADI